MHARLGSLSLTLLLWSALTPFTASASPGDGSSVARASAVPRDASEFLTYWRDGGMPLWFGKEPHRDRRLRELYLPLYERAARGELAAWAALPDSALALVVLLDQFPRNAFRGTPRMYATDELARHVAGAAVKQGFHRQVPIELQKFFVLPFSHSESLADQERAVALGAEIGPVERERTEHHRDIVRRFGRFPHRNSILGRLSTAEEERYLAEGGYSG
jgi:uncharacterized protein (DUF924 family)